MRFEAQVLSPQSANITPVQRAHGHALATTCACTAHAAVSFESTCAQSCRRTAKLYHTSQETVF
jgi:hypothetical protein